MRRIALFMFLMLLTSCLFATPIVYEFAVKKASSFWQWVSQTKGKKGVPPSYSEKLQEQFSHKSHKAPDVIENSIMKMHFNHSEGYIDSLWYKDGSGKQLVDQYWNDYYGRGLGFCNI